MKKFLKVFLLCLALTTLLTVVVSAADATLYADGDPSRKTNTVTFTYDGAETDVVWLSSNPEFATVDNKGVVTAVAPGTTKIIVMKSDYSAKLLEKEVKVINRTLDSIEVSGDFKKTYNSGESFNKTGMVVTCVYDNGDRSTATDYTVTPATLTAKTTAVTISVTRAGVTKTTSVDVTVNEISVKKVELSIPTKDSLKVGDTFPALVVTVTYTDDSKATLSSGYDIYLDGTKVSATKELVASDNNKKVKVYYRNQYSNEVTITVTDEPDVTYSAVISGALTKTKYTVGETIDWTGVTSIALKASDKTDPVFTLTASALKSLASVASSPLAYKFTTTDVGKTTILINFEYGEHKYPILVTGLTITNSLGYLDPYSITDITLVDDTYPVGYTFELDDIDYIRYTATKNGSKIKITGESLAMYADTMSLEVLTTDSKGNPTRKSTANKAYRSIIEEDDILTDTKGDKYINVRLYIGEEYIDTEVEVENAAVTVHYDNQIIGAYEDIDDAIDAVENLDTKKYPLTSKVVVIKLGENQRVSSRTTFTISRNIEIDLNGYTLEFYSDTVDPAFLSSVFALSITNSSKTDAGFSYYDEDIDLVLAKDEDITFKKDYDKEANLPGVYVVTLDVGKNGTVAATPKADKNDEVVIGHGKTLTLVVTPANGYVVDEIAIGRVKYDESDEGYTKKNGVVTLTLKIVEECTITVDFVQGVDEDADPVVTWTNPFTDVSENAAYYSAVAFVNSNGLFKGTSDTKFSPSSTMTRAMFVTVLGRLAGIDETTAANRYGYSSKFSDVSKNDPRYGYYSYAVPYIAWATQNGLIEGHGGNEKGTFGPEDPITHQQMYVIMKRYATFVAYKNTGSSTGVILNYTDKGQIADWALDAVKYAKQYDFIVTTSTNKISPTTNATRAELAMLIEKFAKNVLEWGADAQ